MRDIECIASPRRAAALLHHPLRPQILAEARSPVSASELARRLGQPRQRVNYHVRQLAAAELLEPAGQQRKRNMVELQYIASSRGYVLAQELLGDAAAARVATAADGSAAQLMARYARAQGEVAELEVSAHAAGVRVRTLSLQSDVAFATPRERAGFVRELTDVVNELVARYHQAGTGGALRLVLGCYPIAE